MFGSDFIVIKDNRGFETGFFWSDVESVAGHYEEENWVELTLRPNSDRFKLVMSMTEFLEQVEKQLGAGVPKPSYIAPNPVAIAHLLNSQPDGPSDQIETS